MSHAARYVQIGVGDPRLDDYRRVSDGDALRQRNLFVAEGRLVVGRLFDSGLQVVSLLLNEASRHAMEDSISRLPDDVPVYVCDTEAFGSITGFNLHRGCLALAVRPAELTLSDVARGRVERDLAQWEGICRWLDS